MIALAGESKAIIRVDKETRYIQTLGRHMERMLALHWFYIIFPGYHILSIMIHH